MLKKIILGMLIVLHSSPFHASISDYIINFFYSAHCAGNEYYSLAKKSSSRDIPFLKEAHLYTNALLVHALFPFYFALAYPNKMSALTEEQLNVCGKDFGKAAYASFIVPALGALILAYGCYFSAKKIIHLLKS